MARTKVTETPKPEAPPITLLRIEERQERVDLDDAKKVERMTVAVGMLHTADSLFDEAAELADSAKETKKRAEAKREEGKRILFDAQNGQALQPYPVIIERHPVRPAEMLVWRVADGMTAAELLELEPTETPRDEAAHFAAREAQGCTLLESRATSPEELEVAREADQGRLPFPEGGETMVTEGAGGDGDGDGSEGDRDEEDEDDDQIPDPEDAGDEDEADDTLEAGPAPTDEEVQEGNAPGESGPWKADEDQPEGGESAPPKKSKAANPNVVARVRIALNGLVAGSAYSMPELAERTGHPADDIKPALQQLIEEGFAVQTGKGRGTKYGRAGAGVVTGGGDGEAEVTVL